MSLEFIVPQHAVVLPKQPNDTSLMTYVKSVSSIIGSSNVLAVFDNGTNVKMYLKSSRHVSLLVNQGLVLHGLYSCAEYAVPRGDKVVLSNVDPMIPDDELVKLLGSYGTLESELMYKKPFTECEYSHIKSDVRYVYMNIHDKLNFPCKLDWMLNDMWYEIFVTVEEQNKASPPVISCSRASDPEVAPQKRKLLRQTVGEEGAASTPQNGRLHKMPRLSLPLANGAADVLDSPDDVKPQNLKKFRPGKVKTKGFRPQAALKPKKVSVYARSAGNPHPMTLKKFLRNTPAEVLARYPMDCKQLMLFFKQTYRNRNRNKMELIFALLGTDDAETLRNFRGELVDVSQNMKSVPLTMRVNRVLAEIDAHLAEPQE